MKRTLLFYLIFSAVTFLAASCSKEYSAAPSFDYPSDEIVFHSASGVAVSTKATEVSNSNLTGFNVLCVTGTLGSAETEVFNKAFTGSNAAGYTTDPAEYWPASDPAYKFYASNAALTFTATGPTVTVNNSTDVIAAIKPSSAYKSSNTLQFEHVFARIKSVTVNAPASFGINGVTVKITPKVSGTYSLYAGGGHRDDTGWSDTSDGSEVTLNCDGHTDNGLYLVPGTYTLSIAYTLTKDKWSESYSKTATVTLESGKRNNIIASIPSGDISVDEIAISVTVEEWQDQNVNAEFNMD